MATYYFYKQPSSEEASAVIEHGEDWQQAALIVKEHDDGTIEVVKSRHFKRGKYKQSASGTTLQVRAYARGNRKIKKTGRPLETR